MDETVKKFRDRRDARLKKRLDEFKEGDHPRDENGRFTSGGGSGASSGPNKVVPAKNPEKKGSASQNKVGKEYPVPKSLGMNSVSLAYSNAVDRGQDPVDVLKAYTRAYDKGIKITLGGEKYTKVGENKWKPENPRPTRSSSGFDDDREMAMKIANNFRNQEEAKIEGLKWPKPRMFKGDSNR